MTDEEIYVVLEAIHADGYSSEDYTLIIFFHKGSSVNTRPCDIVTRESTWKHVNSFMSRIMKIKIHKDFSYCMNL